MMHETYHTSGAESRSGVHSGSSIVPQHHNQSVNSLYQVPPRTESYICEGTGAGSSGTTS